MSGAFLNKNLEGAQNIILINWFIDWLVLVDLYQMENAFISLFRLVVIVVQLKNN